MPSLRYLQRGRCWPVVFELAHVKAYSGVQTNLLHQHIGGAKPMREWNIMIIGKLYSILCYLLRAPGRSGGV